ncbi:MAG: hypothetical protein P9L96_02840 [Candidatus Gygaella obscura]|nr:hypothetical protein [Candidatus Gygaella obscura]
MKKCSFCSYESQDNEKLCKNCGADFAEQQKLKWYFKPSIMVLAFFSVGPFVLPLVWLHPRYQLKTKVILSTVILLISITMFITFIKSVESIVRYFDLINQIIAQ